MARPQNETDARQANREYDQATREGEPYEGGSYGEVIEICADDSVDGDFNGAPELAGLDESQNWDGVDVLDGLQGSEARGHNQESEPPEAAHRARLELRRDEALERLEESKPGLSERADARRDSAAVADRANAPDEIETEGVLEEQVARIDRALERLESGEYGRCSSCGKRIEPSLLDEEPERELCATCARDAASQR